MVEELLQSILDSLTGFFSGIFTTLTQNIFDLFHNVVDFFISIVYFAKFIFAIFASLFTPVQFFFYYLKGILEGFTESIANSVPIQFADNVLEILNSIPSFDILMTILGCMIIMILIFGSLKYLST